MYVGGGYAEGKYVVARKSGSTNNKIRVVTSVSLNVVEDNTSRWWLITWHEQGNVVNYGQATGRYEVSNYKRLDNLSFNGGTSTYIPASNAHQIVKFTPKVSGSYLFETSSGNGDPNFILYNASKGTVTSATDDINGSSNRNARLVTNLIAGDVYYIDTFSYNSSYGYTLRIGNNPSTTNTLNKDIAYTMNLSAKSYSMVKFTPTTSGYYDFFTQKTSGDPQLYLFNASGTLLTNDDDSLGNLNSIIRYYLSAGTTYYIAGQGYNGNATTFSLKVIPSITGRSTISINSPKTLTVSTYTYVYEFVAPYTERYDFYTYERTAGDPYLELYDSNRNKIAYNDDGNGDRNALITINLVAGNKYYIHLRGYNTAQTSCKLNIRFSTINRSEIYTSLTSSTSISNDSSSVSVYKFVAPESRYFTIYTNNIIYGDPYLELMDSSGIVLYSDDNSAGGLNAKINFYATEGQEFFIVARGKTNASNSYNLIIN